MTRIVIALISALVLVVVLVHVWTDTDKTIEISLDNIVIGNTTVGPYDVAFTESDGVTRLGVRERNGYPYIIIPALDAEGNAIEFFIYYDQETSIENWFSDWKYRQKVKMEVRNVLGIK